MFKIFDDPFTQLHTAIPNATRPVTVDVEDVTNLDGTELSPVFHARIQNELFTVTAVVVDGGGAGIDRWTMDHLGGAAASAHGVGEPVDVVVTANGLTAGLGDYYMSNPLTTNGDLITRAAGIPARIAVGTTGQRLTVVGGAPAWAAGNPMTTQDDLILGGASGVETRLAKGADSQVLAVDASDHHVKWMASAAGFTNPMTTKGDIIIADTGGAAIRLPGSGTNNWVLTYDTGTNQPKWAAGGGGGGGTYPPTSYADLVKLSGPTGYWKLTEGSGTSFADSSGFTNAGTGHGTTAAGSGGPWSGAKVNFDGTDDYMDFAARPIGAGLLPVTLEWWIKPAAGTFVGLIDTAPSAGGTLRNYNTGFFEKQGANSIAISSMSNAWHHLALILFAYNSGIIHAVVMIDGVVDHTADLNASSVAWATGWTLGNINGGGAGWWSGDMAHFAVYPRALAPSEIKFHFDNATSD